MAAKTFVTRFRVAWSTRSLLWKSGVAAIVTIGLLFIGWPIAVIASAAAAILLLGRIRFKRVYEGIDRTLSLLFVGLFNVGHGFQAHVLALWHFDHWQWLRISW